MITLLKGLAAVVKCHRKGHVYRQVWLAREERVSVSLTDCSRCGRLINAAPHPFNEALGRFHFHHPDRPHVEFPTGSYERCGICRHL